MRLVVAAGDSELQGQQRPRSGHRQGRSDGALGAAASRARHAGAAPVPARRWQAAGAGQPPQVASEGRTTRRPRCPSRAAAARTAAWSSVRIVGVKKPDRIVSQRVTAQRQARQAPARQRPRRSTCASARPARTASRGGAVQAGQGPPHRPHLQGLLTQRPVCDSIRSYVRGRSIRMATRVRALREAMGLSLRDLSERSGVSAPMLSQVERGETSPTLPVAAAHRRRAGPDALAAAAPRRGRRRSRSSAPPSAAPAAPTATATRSSPRRCPASAPSSPATCSRPAPSTGGPGDPPMHEPGARETALVESGAVVLVVDGAAPRAGRRRLRDLRRRPAPPLREPRPRRRRSCWPSCPPDCAAHEHHRPCSTRSGRPTRSPRTCIYIDLHLVHEVTSPQAFDGLRLAGRPVRRPDRTLATADHNMPTDGTPIAARIKDELSRVQVETLERNCAEFGDPGLLAGLRAPGHRPRHRARARRHPAGHDDRLRRHPHGHPRRVRRAGLRHRHQRGRARAGHAVPGPAQAQVDAHPLRGRARPRRHRQGPDPRHDRPDRRRRRRPATSSSSPGRRSRRSRWRAA